MGRVSRCSNADARRWATLFVSFSCGKGVVATAIHMLADRGQLDYDAPVASYWPEFAAHGKDAITVGHVLTHGAGIPQLPPGTTIDDLFETARLAGAEGANVILRGRNPDRFERAASEVQALTSAAFDAADTASSTDSSSACRNQSIM
jgi:CubicO group peptidase (beta-lactamase class C family)